VHATVQLVAAEKRREGMVGISSSKWSSGDSAGVGNIRKCKCVHKADSAQGLRILDCVVQL
jgi:hypothetical protein